MVCGLICHRQISVLGQAVVIFGLSFSLSIFLHSNSHFPGGSGLAGTRMSHFWILLELRMMEVVVTAGAIRRAKLQTKCQH